MTGFAVGGDDQADVVDVRLTLPEVATTLYGAPSYVVLQYRFSREDPRVEIRLRLAGRTASRLPESCWLTVNPLVASPSDWRMTKLGTVLSPLRVVRGGNRNLHTIESMTYEDHASRVTIESVDAPVVAIGRPRILDFDDQAPDLAGGFHINLHNNIWGTNFRMWFDDDMTYRLRLSFDAVTN